MFKSWADYFDCSGGDLLPLLIGCAVAIVCLVIILVLLLRDKPAKTPAQTLPIQPMPAPVPPYVPPVQTAMGQPSFAPPAPEYPQAEAPAPFAPPQTQEPFTPPDNDRTVLTLNNMDPAWQQDSEKTTVLRRRETITIRLTNQNSGERYSAPLTSELTVGRNPARAQLVLENEQSVSGLHCRIFEDNGRIFVQDLHSTNGTVVDGIAANDTMELVNGSQLVLGRLTLSVELFATPV